MTMSNEFSQTLTGKVAIITGAAKGQGRAEAERFIAEGASVMLTDVLDEVHEVARGLGGAARSMAHDVSDRAAWQEVVAATIEAFGGVDILINNAGIHRNTPFLDTSEEWLRKVLDVNLIGSWHGIQTVAPAMIERGGGSVINTASIAGLRAVTMSSAYVMSKFALRGLTKSAAIELAQHKIRVNAILPGLIRTDMSKFALGPREEAMAAAIPLGIVGEPSDIADLALFLASDASRFITGADHVIDGGSMA
jgi:3alpha(or 20beta)-hydroxysteroid dehydrogenase